MILIKKIKQRKKFIIYITCAMFTTIINISIYLLFHKYVTNNILYCNIIAYSVSITIAFVINKKIVYTNKNKNFLPQILLFLIVKLISFLIDSGVLVILHEYMKLNNFWSKIISNSSTTVSNYLLNDKLVFKKGKIKND